MRWKPLLISQLLIGVLMGSFLMPQTRVFWDLIDTAIFKFLNGTLEGRPWVQTFWALVNHKRADLVEDAVFLLFFILGIVKAPQGEKRRRTAQFLFTILLAGSFIFFINRIVLRQHLVFPRESPSLVVTPCIRLSQELPWITIKDETVTCFPGDHATTLFLFAFLYTFFAGKKLGKYAVGYAAFRLLPRLIVGAHWFSDIAVGTTCLVLFLLSWTVLTPFHTWIVNRIQILLGREKVAL